MNEQDLSTNQNAQNMPPDGQTPVQPILIGLSTPDLNDRFLRYLESSARLYADLHRIEYVLADAQNDLQTQIAQVANMIYRDKVQGLIVIPVDTNGMEPITNMAQQADIPLVYLNRQPFPIDNIPSGVYYVGSDPEDAGIKQADFLLENLPQGGVGILMGTAGLESTIRRTEGLEEQLLANNPNIRVIVRDYANFLRQPAYNLVRQWLARFGYDLDVIAANNDEMALGAIQALQEAGRDDVVVLGIDGLLPGREAVRQGLMSGTVFQDATLQGEIAVDMVQRLIRGELPEQQYVLVPHILITSGAATPAPAGN